MEIRNIPPPTYRTEIRELLALCFPIIASSLLLFALNIEDQLIVGHLLTKEDLAAVALANTFFNLFWYVLVGLMSAIDTFGAQAYGAKQYKQVGVWAQRGLFICLVASIPMVLILVTSTQWIVLHVFNQEPNVAAKTALFINFLMPGLPFLIVADVLRRWLQVQGHLSPAVGIQSEGAAREWSTVVDISITPSSFKLVSLALSRFSLSKTPKQVFF